MSFFTGCLHAILLCSGKRQRNADSSEQTNNLQGRASEVSSDVKRIKHNHHAHDEAGSCSAETLHIVEAVSSADLDTLQHGYLNGSLERSEMAGDFTLRSGIQSSLCRQSAECPKLSWRQPRATAHGICSTLDNQVYDINMMENGIGKRFWPANSKQDPA
jgi:hypothetical protein